MREEAAWSGGKEGMDCQWRFVGGKDRRQVADQGEILPCWSLEYYQHDAVYLNRKNCSPVREMRGQRGLVVPGSIRPRVRLMNE